MLRQFRTAMAQSMNTALPAMADITAGSMFDRAMRDYPRATKALSMTGDAGHLDNLFTFTGPVDVKRAGFWVTAVANSAVVTAVGFQMWDGTDIRTLDDGTLVLSTAVLNTLVYKAAANGSPLIKVDPTASLFGEAVIGATPYHGFTATKHATDPTYLRLAWTGAAATDLDIMAFVDFDPTTGEVVPV